MNNEMLLIIAVSSAIIGSVLTLLCGWVSAKLRNACALISVIISFCASACLIPAIYAGNQITVNIAIPLGLNIALSADGLAVFMAVCSSFVGAVIVMYSFGYIRHYENQNEYYFMVVLFLGSMMGLVYSCDLIILYLFWEITAIASWRLIGFFREKEYVLKADKAFMITLGGASFMLVGFLLLYNEVGSFNLFIIKEYFAANPVPNLAVSLILIGILSKSATLPFHTWLPDAGVAPSPVTALLYAAILVKIGVYVFARLFIVTLVPQEIWFTIIPIIAAVSALVSAGAALVENDMKRIIAYSTVSQIAFIILGFSIGSDVGIAGALLYILMHGLAKGGLFLCAGIVEQNTHTKDIRNMGGLISTMPVTAISFIACAFSVMGLPPFGGFFSKYLIFSSAFGEGHVYIGIVFLVGAILTIMYLLRLFNTVFLGEGANMPREGSFIMVASVVILAVVSLLGGIYIRYPSEFVLFTVKQMVGL